VRAAASDSRHAKVQALDGDTLDQNLDLLVRPMSRPFALISLVAAVCSLGAQPARRAAAIEVAELSITELQSLMAAGRVTSQQLVDAYLARIRAYDQNGAALNSMIRLSPSARAEAAQRDAERRAGAVRGPFHGIPVVVKDNFDTRDMPTSGGSLGLATLRPPDDSYVVRRLREAGAVILGKTNMHELAAGITSISSLGGQTRNPYDPRRCPGGSSGGTGVAVAASFAAVGWGSDTCGSIRIPSAYNSLFGLRPTQGLVSRDGVIPLSHTQDIPGPMARTAMDLALALDVSVGYDPRDTTTALVRDSTLRFAAALSSASLGGVRLGVLTNLMTGADGDIRDTLRAAVTAMTHAGAQVVDVTIPGFDSVMAGSSVLNFETKYDLVDYLAATPGAPARSLSEIMSAGLYHDALGARLRSADTVSARDSDAYRRATGKRAVVRDRIVTLLDSLELDALVYPTMQRRPVLIGDPQAGGTCQLSAHSGLPALSAPAGFTADGLPVGLEMLGRPRSDVRLVAIAHAYEKLSPRRRPPPTTPPLLGGRPPAPRSYVASVAAGTSRSQVRFAFHPATGVLTYDARMTGTAADSSLGLFLRRVSASGPSPVIQRVLAPQATRSSGSATLTGVDRSALETGTLELYALTMGATGRVRLAPQRSWRPGT
jgi:Asp-tRNA(Asn)/Glu-tRNA(Gln) amidotransferase A subunit family amidase